MDLTATRRRLRRPLKSTSQSPAPSKDQDVAPSVSKFRRIRPGQKRPSSSDNAVSATTTKKDKDGYKVVCYYTNWSQYRFATYLSLSVFALKLWLYSGLNLESSLLRTSFRICAPISFLLSVGWKRVNCRRLRVTTRPKTVKWVCMNESRNWKKPILIWRLYWPLVCSVY